MDVARLDLLRNRVDVAEPPHERAAGEDRIDSRGFVGVVGDRHGGGDGVGSGEANPAARAALTAFERLEAEARLNGKLRFNGREIKVYVNDRLMAPNSDSTREVLKPELGVFLGKLFQGSEFTLSHGSDPRSLFAVDVKANRAFSVSELLANLAS